MTMTMTMTKTTTPLTLTLKGLSLRPAQVWGTVRIVPIIRDTPLTDLRLARRDYSDDVLGMVNVGDGTMYSSYIPHGIVMRWASDGETAEVPAETRIGSRELRRQGHQLLMRMVRREASDQLRMLPLHLAMEGFLALHFGGPEIAHRYYSSAVLRDGLSPRVETTVRGAMMPGLAEALSVFERYDGQCGALVFVGDALASALIVGHPDDYLALHDALLSDFYPELLYRYGWWHRRVPEAGVTLSGTTLDEIEASLAAQVASWAAFTEDMAAGLFGRETRAEKVRTVGRYRLMRFLTGTDVRAVPDAGEHLGEALVAKGGELAYLKTYRLDRGPVRRAKVLLSLAAHEWDIQALADSEGHGNLWRVVTDIENAGLGWIIGQELRAKRR